MAAATDKDEREKPRDRGKSPVEKLGEFVEGFLEELKSLLDPPRPVRVPVTAGGSRRPR